MMKRNEKSVPKFDEIIFANRNKEYGAYDLRKRYKATTTLSALGTSAICCLIFFLFSLKPEPGIAVKGKEMIVILKPENYTAPKVAQPEVRPPAGLIRQVRNVVPIVTDDTADYDEVIPITDDLINTTVNGDVDDSPKEVEPTDIIIPVEPEVFVVVEEPPVFPGGDPAILDYLTKHTQYPDEAIQNNIEGRVILKFVVTPDGSVGKIEILKSVDPLLDREAVRVVSTLPKFTPGRQGGTPVHVWFTVPVLFRLERM